MAGNVFINYRREDTAPWAGRLYERLTHDFKKRQLFMDVNSMEPGVDFVKTLDAQVASCDAFICIIGRSWLDAKNAQGVRRLDDPHDFVRIELESALKRDIRVIPVLVDGALMPRADELPEALAPLARRHAVELTHARFGSDVEGLADTLKRAVRTRVAVPLRTATAFNRIAGIVGIVGAPVVTLVAAGQMLATFDKWGGWTFLRPFVSVESGIIVAAGLTVLIPILLVALFLWRKLRTRSFLTLWLGLLPPLGFVISGCLYDFVWGEQIVPTVLLTLLFGFIVGALLLYRIRNRQMG
jgi:hypothetical protein